MAEKRAYIKSSFDMSYEKTLGGFNMPYSHHHKDYEIYILLTGQREVTIGGTSYLINAGNATLFASELSHQSFGQTDYSGICIHFSRNFLTRFFRTETIDMLLACFDTPIIAIPNSFQKKLLGWTKKESWREADSFLLLASILMKLNEFSSKKSSSDTVVSKQDQTLSIEKIIYFMDTNYTEIASVDDISKALGISKSYIHRAVKEKTGLTVKDYINKKRMAQAIRLLAYPLNTMEHIACDCGYSSASYFFRVFKKIYGITPASYRKTILLQQAQS